MDIIGKPARPADGDAVKDSSMATFVADVIQASMKVPVVVDFWAPWCGPCRQLGPLIEKVVRGTGGKVRLVKVNIDEPQNQPLAQQLRIQSIPAVYAFHRGQPVDGFVGALPESQIKQFVERLAGDRLAPDPLEQLLEHGKAALAENNPDAAIQAFSTALQQDPGVPAALAGLARAYLAKGDLRRARKVLDQAPAPVANDSEVAAAKTALALAEEAGAASGRLAELEAKVAADTGDQQARFDLALAQVGAGRRQDAVDNLLGIVRRNRTWNDDAARKQLVKLFEAFGPTDPLTVDGRRRLSSILFS
jgi:putative thioredoxin